MNKREGQPTKKESHATKTVSSQFLGGAYGGGLEMIFDCVLVVADEPAKSGFPEVARGVVAFQRGNTSFDKDNRTSGEPFRIIQKILFFFFLLPFQSLQLPYKLLFFSLHEPAESHSGSFSLICKTPRLVVDHSLSDKVAFPAGL